MTDKGRKMRSVQQAVHERMPLDGDMDLVAQAVQCGPAEVQVAFNRIRRLRERGQLRVDCGDAWRVLDAMFAVQKQGAYLRFMDELPAADLATDWLNSIRLEQHRQGRPTTQQDKQVGADGTAVLVWCEGRPLAMAVLLRDDANFTLLHRVQFSDSPVG